MFGIIKSSPTFTDVAVSNTSRFSSLLSLVIYLYFATPDPSPIPCFISFASTDNLLLWILAFVIVGAVLSNLSIVIFWIVVFPNSSLYNADSSFGWYTSPVNSYSLSYSPLSFKVAEAKSDISLNAICTFPIPLSFDLNVKFLVFAHFPPISFSDIGSGAIPSTFDIVNSLVVLLLHASVAIAVNTFPF